MTPSFTISAAVSIFNLGKITLKNETLPSDLILNHTSNQSTPSSQITWKVLIFTQTLTNDLVEYILAWDSHCRLRRFKPNGRSTAGNRHRGQRWRINSPSRVIDVVIECGGWQQKASFTVDKMTTCWKTWIHIFTHIHTTHTSDHIIYESSGRSFGLLSQLSDCSLIFQFFFQVVFLQMVPGFAHDYFLEKQ